MENTPEAAPQNTGTEATNTNNNQAPVESPVQPDMHGFTGEQLAEMAKFMEANGGFNKAFKTFKDRISNPAPEQPAQQPAKDTQQLPQQQPQPQEPLIQLTVPTGFMSQKEFLVHQYYNSLANQEEFAPIADKIRNGEVFNEMRKFGIQPMDANGNINDAQAREFLSLLAKTVPAKPAETPAASMAPTVDYIPTNQGKIDNAQQAMQIIAQSAQLKDKGLAEHPDIAAAKEFLKNAWGKK
jgi:hypothetical protein